MVTIKDVQKTYDDPIWLVFWRDTYGPKSTWSLLRDVDNRDKGDYAANCITIGFKLRETEHAYYLAPTVADWDKPEKAVCGLMMIPKASIYHVKMMDQVIDHPEGLDEERRNRVVEWVGEMMEEVGKAKDKEVREKLSKAVMKGQEGQAQVSSGYDPKKEWSENIELDKEIQDAQEKDVRDIEQQVKDMRMESSLSGGVK